MITALSQARWPVILLLGLFVAQGLYLIQDTSPTTDETAFHMVNGYTYLKTHDYRMSPANPALVRQWMALPWLVINPKLDLSKKAWHEADSVPFSLEVFYKDNRAIANKLLYSARFMVLVFGAALGLLIYLWSRQLYGPEGGLLSLFIYSFCPSFLGHSAVATTDIGVTLFTALSGFFLWRYLRNSNVWDLLGFGAAFGLAAASKYNALIFGPLFLLVIWIRKGFIRFVVSALVTTVVSFLVVWAAYFFEWKPLLWDGVPRIEEKMGYIAAISQWLSPGNTRLLSWLQEAALKASIPIPSFILGVAGIIRSHQEPYMHFSFGEWTTIPKWYHYFFVFVVKMTPAFLLLIAGRVIFFKRASKHMWDETLTLLLPFAVYLGMTYSDTTGVGVRYLLPIIPFLFVWIGGLTIPAMEIKPLKFFLIACCIGQALSSALSFPNHFSYFNWMAGGSKGGHRYVRGGDTDMGQGLVHLSRYLKKRGNPEIVLDHFGTADPSFYGIRYVPFTEEERKRPLRKIYALGIMKLEGVEWSKKVEPAYRAANSILVYDFTSSDASF